MADKILLVEDDDGITVVIQDCIEALGYEMVRAADGKTGLELALENDHLLVILDIMLPKLDGLEVCQRLRREKEKVPILMITARDTDTDQILGLEFGADDYITKPFNIQTFRARIKALLRRSHVESKGGGSDGEAVTITFRNLEIDRLKHKVFLGEEEIELTRKEYDLLVLLASNPGVAFSREKLLQEVWGEFMPAFDTTVNTCINRIRTKIEADPSKPEFIKTIRGLGYRFSEAED